MSGRPPKPTRLQAGGYREPKFWTEGGWKWKGDPSQPDDYDAVFQTANHPRVGVSWYEASAFCRWLSEQLKLGVTAGRAAPRSPLGTRNPEQKPRKP